MQVRLAFAVEGIVAADGRGLSLSFRERAVRESGLLWDWLLDRRVGSFAIATNAAKEAAFGGAGYGAGSVLRIAWTRKGTGSARIRASVWRCLLLVLVGMLVQFVVLELLASARTFVKVGARYPAILRRGERSIWKGVVVLKLPMVVNLIGSVVKNILLVGR